jgi:CBS domain-containing protein
MGIHVIGCRAPALVRVESGPAFEGFRDLPVRDIDRAGSFANVHVDCQAGADAKSGVDCLTCRRFRGWDLHPDHQVTIRCRWSSEDPVTARMTLPAALVTVQATAPAAQADEAARRAGVRHLLVLDGRQLVGVLCRCDLVSTPAHVPVAALMRKDLFALDARETLGVAAAAMRRLAVGALPVVSDFLVLGVITRGDLRRAGVPEELLGARRCAACGSVHGVRAHPRLCCVDFCLDCLELEGGDVGVVD